MMNITNLGSQESVGVKCYKENSHLESSHPSNTLKLYVLKVLKSEIQKSMYQKNCSLPAQVW